MPWQDDGAGLLTAAGAEVRFTGVAAGSKGNALWHAGGNGLYEFTLAGPSGLWLGVSTPARFAAGWQLKGLFFGGPGNTSDGSALVAGGWGPAFSAGDVIGMRVERDAAGRVTLAFSRNGAGLGTAFDVAGCGGEGELRPCVSLDTEGQAVAIAERGAAALPPLAALARAPPAGAGIEGEWRGRYDLHVAGAGAGAWSVSARIGNTLGCRVAAGADGALRCAGGVRSTMMMPPPEVFALEQEAAAMLQALSGLRRDGAGLVLEGAGKAERFERCPGPAPAQREQIHWLN